MRTPNRVAALAAGVLIALAGADSSLARPRQGAAEAVANLILGQCLSEVTHAPLPADAIRINPLVRRPLGPPTDPRLSPRASPATVASGAVYVDHHGEGCEVFATGVDRAEVMTALNGLIAARGLRVRQLNQPAGPNAEVDISFGAMADASIPVLAISTPAGHPDQLTARLATTRQVSVTEDSSQGWLPTDAQVQSSRARMRSYLHEVDESHYAAAYAMLSDGMHQVQSLQAFTTEVQGFNTMAGAVRDHRVGRVTWTKDPPGGPPAGVYVAFDMVSHYANVDRACGYVVLYQAPSGGDFRVLRVENNYIPNSQAADMDMPGSTAGVDAVWAQMTAQCPSYDESVVAAPLG